MIRSIIKVLIDNMRALPGNAIIKLKAFGIRLHPLAGVLSPNKKSAIKKALFWKSLWILLAFVFIVNIELLVFYTLPESSDDLISHTRNLHCSISFPSKIATLDEQIMQLTLTNNMGIKVTGVKSYLIYPEDLPIIITSENGSTVSDFGDLQPKETRTKEIRFFLNRKIDANRLGFRWIVTAGDKIEIERGYKIGFFSTFPYIKRVSFGIMYAFASALVTLLIALLSEKVKGII